MTAMNSPAPTPLTPAQYQDETEAVLAAVESQLDRWLEEDVVDVDAARTGGLLELSFPDRSKIVINTQPPLHELWLASRSGGYHFQFVDGVWRDTRDGQDFFAKLSACASEQAARPLVFTARD
jgi:CyaY protein